MLKQTIAFFILGAAAFSFSVLPGGEGFEISLNDKVIVQRFGNDMNNVQTLQLNSAKANDKLIIKYYHCGRVGKNRVISFKDEQNNVIKEIHFDDVNNPVAAMSLLVKDIMSLKKGNTTLKLYYSSSELPKGRMLVTINTSRTNLSLP